MMSSVDDAGAEKLVNSTGDVKISCEDMMTNVDDAGAENTGEFIESLLRKVKKNSTGDVKMSCKDMISHVEDKGAETLLNSVADARSFCKDMISHVEDEGAETLLNSVVDAKISCKKYDTKYCGCRSGKPRGFNQTLVHGTPPLFSRYKLYCRSHSKIYAIETRLGRVALH